MKSSELLFFVTEIAKRLREYGVKCGTSESIDAYAATGLVNIKSVDDLKQVMKLCMVKRVEDYEVFDRVFEEMASLKKPTQENQPSYTESYAGADEKKIGRGEVGDKGQRKAMMAYYSPVEILLKRELPTPTIDFLRENKRVMKRLRRRLALLPGRRFEKSTTGLVDLGGTIRQSLRTYGELMRILRMRRKITRCKLIALFDVSGSMDTYTEDLMQSMYALARQGVAVEVFIFSTRLLKVSNLLKYFGPKRAAELVSREVDIWGSGTRIGSCIMTFMEKYGGLVGRGTVVMIVSDGWDTGDPELLDSAMKRLKSMVGRLIWINPHADKPGFKPRTIGMETAMPYIDILAGISALKSIRSFIKYFGTSFQPMSRRSRAVSRLALPFRR